MLNHHVWLGALCFNIALSLRLMPEEDHLVTLDEDLDEFLLQQMDLNNSYPEEEQPQRKLGARARMRARMQARQPSTKMYNMAQMEEGIHVSGPPEFPFMLMFPRSFVNQADKILSEQTTKTRKYNFIGSSWVGTYRAGARHWIQDFIKEQFTANDFYVDVAHRWQPGEGHGNHTRQWKHAHYGPDNNNTEYGTIMAQSEFTLCPAGDSPWSYRFAEAMFLKSIPIVKNAMEANTEQWNLGAGFECPLGDGNCPKYTPSVGFHYYVYNPDPNFAYVYNATWAEENYQKVKQHHTLMKELGTPIDNRGGS